MQKDGRHYMSYRVKNKITIKDYAIELVSMIVATAYDILYHFIKRESHNGWKYKSAICAIFKDEAPYLKEWIVYHRTVGIERFYMYNNRSTDDYKSVLRPFIDAGIVELIEWPYQQGQMSAYEDCIKNRKNETEWIGFIDIDEFVVPIEDNTITSFLDRFSNRPSVLINWKMFGTSGYYEADHTKLVTRRFTHSWAKGCNVGKCFYNSGFSFDFEKNKGNAWMHQMWCRRGKLLLPSVNSYGKTCIKGYQCIPRTKCNIQINHYYTKSFVEYLQKSFKGDAYYENTPKNMGSFYKCELRCSVDDHSIFRYLSTVKRNMIKENVYEINEYRDME